MYPIWHVVSVSDHWLAAAELVLVVVGIPATFSEVVVRPRGHQGLDDVRCAGLGEPASGRAWSGPGRGRRMAARADAGPAVNITKVRPATLLVPLVDGSAADTASPGTQIGTHEYPYWARCIAWGLFAWLPSG